MSSKSLIHGLYSLQSSYSESLQSLNHVRVRSCLGDGFLNHSSHWSVYRSDAPFKRRVTCIDWHPTYHNSVAFGSHAGDILLWKYERDSQPLASSENALIEGIGYGYGSITSMKFHPKNPNCMYSTSVNNGFRLQDFTEKKSVVYLVKEDYGYWWVSFDFCLDHNLLFVGDNHGKAVLLSSEGELIKEIKRLHRGKIKHAEFCPSQNWTLATSSVDRTVSIWDIRMLRDDDTGSIKPISVLSHNAPISSSHFDPITGTRLLTTSQNGELRVYDSYNQWSKPTSITDHAHRFFQRLTDITATWHPLYDNICVVGRYPRPTDTSQVRGVDMINLETGKTEGFFYSPHVTGLMPVNKFNKSGEALASGEGSRVVIWKMEDIVDEIDCKRDESKPGRSKRSRVIPGFSEEVENGLGTLRKRKRRPAKKDDTMVKKLKQKISETTSISKKAKKS